MEAMKGLELESGIMLLAERRKKKERSSLQPAETWIHMAVQIHLGYTHHITYIN